MNPNLIERAIQRCKEVGNKYGNIPPFPSVSAQLQYLSELISGRSTDRSRLSEIVLGVQAAREVESLDEPLADLLHEVSAEVDRMRRGGGTGDG